MSAAMTFRVLLLIEGPISAAVLISELAGGSLDDWDEAILDLKHQVLDPVRGCGDHYSKGRSALEVQLGRAA